MLDTTNTQVLETVRGAPAEEHRRMTRWLDERIVAAKKKPSVEIVTLTPVLASLLLTRNSVNRPISRINAASLSSDIASGRFVFNGESIVVSETGTLNDGQHRCMQVVATGRPIETVIVFGAKEETRFTIDTGKSKSASNLLHMKGRKYTHVLASAVNYHLQWQDQGFINYGGSDINPTKAQIIAAADELHGIDKSIEFTSEAMKTIRSHAVLAFCHYVFKKRAGLDAADQFIGKLIDGDGLRKGDPIHYCRNRLLQMNRGNTANDRCELVFKCWNKWRTGATVTTFRFTGGKLPKLER